MCITHVTLMYVTDRMLNNCVYLIKFIKSEKQETKPETKTTGEFFIFDIETSMQRKKKQNRTIIHPIFSSRVPGFRLFFHFKSTKAAHMILNLSNIID